MGIQIWKRSRKILSQKFGIRALSPQAFNAFEKQDIFNSSPWAPNLGDTIQKTMMMTALKLISHSHASVFKETPHINFSTEEKFSGFVFTIQDIEISNRIKKFITVETATKRYVCHLLRTAAEK